MLSVCVACVGPTLGPGEFDPVHVVGNSSELQGGSSMEQSRQQLDVSHTCAAITLHLKRQSADLCWYCLAAGDNQVPVPDDQPSEAILPAAELQNADGSCFPSLFLSFSVSTSRSSPPYSQPLNGNRPFDCSSQSFSFPMSVHFLNVICIYPPVVCTHPLPSQRLNRRH